MASSPPHRRIPRTRLARSGCAARAPRMHDPAFSPLLDAGALDTLGRRRGLAREYRARKDRARLRAGAPAACGDGCRPAAHPRRPERAALRAVRRRRADSCSHPPRGAGGARSLPHASPRRIRATLRHHHGALVGVERGLAKIDFNLAAAAETYVGRVRKAIGDLLTRLPAVHVAPVEIDGHTVVAVSVARRPRSSPRRGAGASTRTSCRLLGSPAPSTNRSGTRATSS